MTADKLKEAVSKVIGNSGIYTQVYLILRDNDKLKVCLADIEDQNTEPELQRLFLDYIRSFIVENEELKVRDLSGADESKNTVYQYDYDEYPEELQLLKQFKIDEAIHLPKFNFKEDDLGHLSGYIVYIGTMLEGITLYKKHYPISLIKREAFLLGALKSKERFQKLDGDDIIRLNGACQLLSISGNLYVLDLNVLERNMGFSALIQKSANESVEAIESLQLIEDIEVLKDTLTEPSFARKLSKIKKSSPIFRLGITTETIISFTKTTPELIGKFKYSEDGSRIRLDTKKSKNTFLKLMNDSFLRSELTKQYYEASAKDNISQEQES